MFALVLIFAVVVGLVYYFMSDNRRMKKLAETIPGPKGYPILGNSLMFLRKPSEIVKYFYYLSTIYKELVALWLGQKLIVFIFNAQDVEVILRDKKAMTKAGEYRFLAPWLGDSILLTSGPKFRTHKKIIMPAFYTNGLRNNVELFNKHAQKLVKSLTCELSKDEFDIQNYLFQTMLGQLLETTLGVTEDTIDSDSMVEYGKANGQLAKITHTRIYNFWLRFDSIFRWSSLYDVQQKALDIVHPLCERIISTRKAEIQANFENIANKETGEEALEATQENDPENNKTKRNPTLVDLLINSTLPDGSKLTDEDIKNELLTILFGGQDSTTVSMGFTLSLLGLYHDIQDKIYSELQEIFGNSNRDATYDDLQKMVYLEQVMQESWRLYPPIPLVARHINDDLPMASTNCSLPKGCSVAILLGLLHRNPKYYDNPHKFDPDNFLPEKIKSRHPYAFIPFSGGIRTCVGAKYATLNMKILLSTILRNYKVNSKRPEQDFKLVAEVTLKRREGFPINLEPRQNAPFLPEYFKKTKSINEE